MKPITSFLAALVLFLAVTGIAQAAPLKAYVAEFTISGVTDRDELKATLQGLLASRLNPEQVQLVENRDKAELTVSGSYARFGKFFSLDVLLRNLISGSLTKVFEQGEGQDDLLPAIGRLSGKIERALAKSSAASELAAAAPAPAAPVAPAVPAVPIAATAPAPAVAPPVPVTPSLNVPQAGYQVAAENTAAAGTAAPAPVVAAPQDSYQIRSSEGSRTSTGSWTSPPMGGIFTAIALGRTLPGGEREIFVAADRTIRYYLKGAELKLVAETTIAIPAKILTIDTADLDADGTPELYVTIFDRETPSSRVYQPTAGGLEKLADNLPWFFRGIGHDVKSRTIHAQEMVTGGTFFGGVGELVKTGKTFAMKNPRQMPRSGYVFNFNRLVGTGDKEFLVVLNEDGYLVVSSPDGEETWKSSDKYGGSENNFKVESIEHRRVTGDDFRWTFLEQRIVVTPEGILLVPRNEGMFNIGNNRSYTKYSLHALGWNGSSLQEKWHTRLSQGYLADFAYDATAQELVLLEVVQKAGLFNKGRTVISINRID